MRKTIGPWIAGLCLLAACAQVPPPEVSPVDIEEAREDVKLLEKDLIVARDRAKKLSAELASRKAELASKKDKPDELRRRLEELKKGSGRGEKEEKKKGDDKESA